MDAENLPSRLNILRLVPHGDYSGMSFVSYAQNFEDVMLWRALKHIECGFYIDVGANDPEVDSVTKAFYDRGWHGINIEPVSQWFERLQIQRNRDINLQIAVGAENGEADFYEIPDTGLSTFEKNTADRHANDRGFTKYQRKIWVETLNSIYQRFNLQKTPIQFLKIDVEGSEKDVLSGIDLKIIRPWIILVESTLPMTQVECYSSWEYLLTSAEYDFVYFDGVNRYYIAREHSELKEHFRAPPNCFDGFISRRELVYKLKVQQAEIHLQEANNKAQQAEALIAKLKSQLFDAELQEQQWREQADKRLEEIFSLQQSSSWRLTMPIRSIKRIATGDLTPIYRLGSLVVQVGKQALRPLAATILRTTLKHPTLRYNLSIRLRRYPKLYQSLNLFARNRGLLPSTLIPLDDNFHAQDRHNNPSPRTKRIYENLKSTLELRGEAS